MSFVDKLLDGVDVEWRALKELTLPTANIRWQETEEEIEYIDLTSVSIKTKRITETKAISTATAPSRARKLVKVNDVLFATTRPAQQRYCLVDSAYDGAVASTGYCVLRAKSDVVLPKWILYWAASTAFKLYVDCLLYTSPSPRD